MKKQGFAALAAGAVLFVFLFVFSEQFTAGFNVGLKNCGEIIIPALFPFLIASSLTGAGRLPNKIKKTVAPVTNRLFSLPPECLPAIILSQFGGYLSGAKSAESLYSSGVISRSQARKLMLFCINSGMGFSVNAIGYGLLNSRESGKLILFSLALSAVILGFFIRFLPEEKSDFSKLKPTFVPLSEAVVNSVSAASQTMLASCGFVCVFSGFSSITNCIINNETLRMILSCILEVTNGCVSVAGKVSLPVIAAICAFGGICIHIQIFAVCKSFGIKIPVFYLFRILHSVLAFAVCKAILYFHPIEQQTFVSVSSDIRVWSFSAPAAISLLFMCALLILDLDNNKKIC